MHASSLRFKLSLSIALILAFSMGTLSFLAWRSMSSNAEESISRSSESMKATVNNRLLEIAQISALETSALLNRNFDVALHFASMLSGTAHGSGHSPYTRAEVKKMAHDMLLAIPSASSIYAQFDTNGYDNRDSDYLGNSEYSSETGSMGVYWIANEQGPIYSQVSYADQYDETIGDNGLRKAEWYLCSRETRKPCMAEPYLYEVTPRRFVLLTSLVAPVLVNNEFRGVTGIDIDLPVLQTNILAQSANLYGGKTSMYL